MSLLVRSHEDTTDRSPLLSVQGLTVSVKTTDGWRTVIRDLSFDLQAGETLGLVGESGSGKSVTSLSIMRLVSPRTATIKGKALFGQRDLLALPEKEMAKVRGDEIAMMFQEPMTSLNPVLRAVSS
ncbi:ABC-type microcin C transport system duplicated ATPase subunit YejF [Bradyrhizobium sp. USDA 4506]